MTKAAYKSVLIFELFNFVILLFSTGLLLFTPEVKGSSRSNMFFQGGASSLGVTLSRYVPFFPLWFPVGGFVAADSFSGLNFDVVPILGSVYAI